MYEVMIEEEFSAAHALRGYRGKCENLHGHNWKVEVYVRGERLDDVGMLGQLQCVLGGAGLGYLIVGGFQLQLNDPAQLLFVFDYQYGWFHERFSRKGKDTRKVAPVWTFMLITLTSSNQGFLTQVP